MTHETRQKIGKVTAYITRGDKLLVFTHRDAPSAGLQVPAGTIKDGESAVDAVLREAYEETGLTGLRIERLIARYEGECEYFPPDRPRVELHDRYVFHLTCTGDTPARWQHIEDNGGEPGATPHVFELFWMPMKQAARELIADQGRYLHELVGAAG